MPPETTSPKKYISYSFAKDCVDDGDHGKRRCYSGGEKAVIAKRMENVSLEIEQPNGRGEHDAGEKREQRSALRVTKRGQQRETERAEISKRSERGQGHG